MVISLHRLELMYLEIKCWMGEDMYLGNIELFILIAGNFKRMGPKTCEVFFIFPFLLS